MAFEDDGVSDDKRTARVIVWMPEDLELRLHRLANRDQRKLSDYVNVVLRRHVYGHDSDCDPANPDANRAESRQDDRRRK